MIYILKLSKATSLEHDRRNEIVSINNLNIPRTFSAGWRLCLECVCEGLVVGSGFFHLSCRLDPSPIFEYALT